MICLIAINFLTIINWLINWLIILAHFTSKNFSAQIAINS